MIINKLIDNLNTAQIKMFENEAKGWHGCYSSIGRNSAEQYHLILIKDSILSGRSKKKKIKDYFSTDDNLTKNNNNKTEEEKDIFTEPSTKDKILEKKEILKNRKEICEPYTNKDIPEKYKYHQIHHRELHNYNLFMKENRKYFQTSTSSNAKIDGIWKRTITGPSWDMLSGRDNNNVKTEKIKNNKTEKKINTKNDKNNNNKNNKNSDKTLNIENTKKKLKKSENKSENKSEKNPSKSYFNFYKKPHFGNDTNSNIITNLKKTDFNNKFKSIFQGLTKNKQTKRDKLPTSYDLRIRKELPFTSNTTSFYTKRKYKKLDTEKKIPLLQYPKKNNSIDFSKSLSREQYNFLRRDRGEMRPFFNPNYSQVESRCLTMVSYGRKKKGKSKMKIFNGIDQNLFFEPDKVINKYNNHKEVNAPNFKIMVSRPSNGPLPSYMVKKFDRASLETITEKGLKMNGYSDVGFQKNNFSSFYPKKSFNKIVNYNLLNNDKFIEENLGVSVKDLNHHLNMKKLIEFYSNTQNDSVNGTQTKFDAITLKTVHNN